MEIKVYWIVKILYSHNGSDDEESSAPDDADNEHGKADVPRLLEVAPNVPGHVAVCGAENHQQEVVQLQPKEGGDALMADLEMSVARVHVNQVQVSFLFLTINNVSSEDLLNA